jgi:hypothetical protein
MARKYVVHYANAARKSEIFFEFLLPSTEVRFGLSITEIANAERGGTLEVPFQDKGHVLTRERQLMTFFFALAQRISLSA